MASAPINSPQARNSVESVGLIAGKTTSYGFGNTAGGILPIQVLTGLNIQQLAIDAIAVVAQDSVRSGSFQVETKLISSYVSNTALYQLWGRSLVLPLLSNIDISFRDDMAKFLWNSALMPVSARIFGGRISMTNSILTSAGTGFFAKGLDTVISK